MSCNQCFWIYYVRAGSTESKYVSVDFLTKQSKVDSSGDGTECDWKGGGGGGGGAGTRGCKPADYLHEASTCEGRLPPGSSALSRQ